MLRFSDAHFEEAQGEALGYEEKKIKKLGLGSQPLQSMVSVCVWLVALEPLNMILHAWMLGSIGVLVLFAVKS